MKMKHTLKNSNNKEFSLISLLFWNKVYAALNETVGGSVNETVGGSVNEMVGGSVNETVRVSSSDYSLSSLISSLSSLSSFISRSQESWSGSDSQESRSSKESIKESSQISRSCKYKELVFDKLYKGKSINNDNELLNLQLEIESLTMDFDEDSV